VKNIFKFHFPFLIANVAFYEATTMVLKSIRTLVGFMLVGQIFCAGFFRVRDGIGGEFEMPADETVNHHLEIGNERDYDETEVTETGGM
jgi:hypothetical protein